LNFLFISITIDTNISSHDSRIINIKARKCLSKNELQESALPVQLNSDPQFAYDLLSAYDIYMQKKAALIHRRVEFYEHFSYTFLDDDGRFDSYLDLYLDDVVQIQEENGLSYAIIKALFTHEYNDGLVYAFIWVDWLRECLTPDPVLQCPIYEIQTAENTRWYRVYPISLIDSLPKVHFVHRCQSTCTTNSHDLLNNQYFKNEFYYTPI